jgi:hypothetical protein
VIELSDIQRAIVDQIRVHVEHYGRTDIWSVAALAAALEEPEFRIRAELHGLERLKVVREGQARDPEAPSRTRAWWSLTDFGEMVAWQTRLDV